MHGHSITQNKNLKGEEGSWRGKRFAQVPGTIKCTGIKHIGLLAQREARKIKEMVHCIRELLFGMQPSSLRRGDRKSSNLLRQNISDGVQKRGNECNSRSTMTSIVSDECFAVRRQQWREKNSKTHHYPPYQGMQECHHHLSVPHRTKIYSKKWQEKSQLSFLGSQLSQIDHFQHSKEHCSIESGGNNSPNASNVLSLLGGISALKFAQPGAPLDLEENLFSLRIQNLGKRPTNVKTNITRVQRKKIATARRRKTGSYDTLMLMVAFGSSTLGSRSWVWSCSASDILTCKVVSSN